MHGKSASEHNFSGVGCNFRAFQGTFPGANKIQGLSESSRVFQSLPGFPGFVGYPIQGLLATLLSD